ncbi:MAG TPA: DUF6498-containing protein [Dehalococcoidia bacterium]
MARILGQTANLILIAANLVPLIGVIFWGWDAFVLLMLYWLETAVIAFWTILRIATMKAGALGDITFDSGKPVTSSLGMAAFFTLHAGIFMLVHFVFLWVLFSGDWSQRIHGVRDFINLMVIGTGLWVPLLVLFIARGATMLFEGMRPQLLRWFNIVPHDRPEPSALSPAESLVLGLYFRIVLMQITIIVGAWFAMLFGSVGALAFLIFLKTAIDLSFQGLVTRTHNAWAKAKAEQTNRSRA